MEKLIVILGPTASGKSEFAIELAEKFNGQIVSADSRQIYQELNIGTAKIKEEDKKNITHYLLDFIKPNQDFSLAEYKKAALKAISQVHQENQLPFLVGGTGLYIQAIVDNLAIPQAKPDPRLRQEIEKEIEKEGLKSVYEKLLRIDPGAKDFIDPKNPRRIIRALEVCYTTGQPFSAQRKKQAPLFESLQIGLDIDFEKLEEKIDNRVEAMIKEGLIEETKKILQKYKASVPALQTIGYQETLDYLQGKINLKDAKELIKLHTRQYAKRQLTWLKKDKRIKWVRSRSEAKKIIKSFLD